MPTAPELASPTAFEISDAQRRAIAEVPYFSSTIYSDLDVAKTLAYMHRRYVLPISKRLTIADTSILDCAAGFGWMSFAFLLSGGKSAVLVDPDEPRLTAAEAIAHILGVHDRCRFVCAYLQDVDLPDDAVDVVLSIETLEHVGRENVAPCVETIARLASKLVVVTTPNHLFPVVQHDTSLPFAHWLPSGVRKRYAEAFGRGDQDVGNYFLRPWELAPLQKKFKADTSVQTFNSMAEFMGFYPHYLPYGSKEAARWRRSPPKSQVLFHQLTSRTLGNRSFTLAPNLSAIWVRR
jgi:ubiquinone/menaquinone biosynthesis C-methylase UbiE